MSRNRRVAELNLQLKAIEFFAPAQKSIGVLKRLGEAVAGLEARLTKMSARLKTSSDSLKAFGSRVQTAGRGIRQAGVELTAGITLPILAVGRAAIKARAEYEAALAGVAKTSDTTAAQVEAGIAQQLKALAEGAIPLATNELLRFAAVGGQLGISQGNLATFAETVARLSVSVDGLTGEEAASQLARLVAATGTAQEDIPKLSNVLVDLGNNFAANEADILSFSRFLTGIPLNIAASEILGIGAALKALGANAQAGGSAIQRFFLELLASRREGGQQFIEFANVAGLSVQELSNRLDNDAAGALDAFVQGLSRIRKGGGDVSKALADLDLQDLRVIRTFGQLSRGANTLTAALKLQEDQFNNGNAAVVESNKRFAALDAVIERLQNKFKNVREELGEALLPVITNFIALGNRSLDALRALVVQFDALDPSTRIAIANFATIVAVLAAVVIPLGLFVTFIGFAISGLGVFSKGLSLGGKGLLNLKPAFAAASIAGRRLLTTFVDLRTNMTILKGLGVPLGKSLKIAFADVGSFLARSRFLLFFTGLPGIAALAIGAIVKGLFDVRNEVVHVDGSFITLRNVVVGTFTIIKDAFDKFIGQLKLSATLLLDSITTPISKALDKITFGPTFTKIIREVKSFVTNFDASFQTITDGVLIVGEFIIDVFALAGLGIGFLDQISLKVFENIKKNALSFFPAIAAVIKAAFDPTDFRSLTDVFLDQFVGFTDGVLEVSLLANEHFDQILNEKTLANFLKRANELGKALPIVITEGTGKAEGPAEDAGNDLGGAIAKGAVITFGSEFKRGFEQAIGEFIREAQNAAEQGNEFFVNTFGRAEDAILDFLETGEFSAKAIADVFIKELNRIVVKQALAGVFEGLGFEAAVPEEGQPAGQRSGIAQVVNTLVGGAKGALTGGTEVNPATEQKADTRTNKAVETVAAATTAAGNTTATAVQDQTQATQGFFSSLGSSISSGFSALASAIGLGGGGGGGAGAAASTAASAAGSAGTGATLGGAIGAVGSLVGLGFAIAELFQFGGVAGQQSRTALVPAGAFSNADRFQFGGGPDKIPALLSPGERVLNPRETRAFETGRQASGGDSRPLIVNFNLPEGADPRGFIESQEQIQAVTAASLRRAEGRTN